MLHRNISLTKATGFQIY